MSFRLRWRRGWTVAARAAAAVGVAAAMMFIGAPLDAHHSVDFESYDCAEPTPSPEPQFEDPQLPEDPEESPEGTEDPPSGAEPTSPPQNCMPSSGERIWGNRLIRFSTSPGGSRPIRRVALYILSEDEGIPHALDGKPLLEETFARADEMRSYDSPFAWNSTEVTPYNGKYRIRVEVDAYTYPIGNETHRERRERDDLRVDNPPRAVGAPKILATTTGSVTVQWTAAPEPDVLSYTIYRAVTKTKSQRPPPSAFKQVGVTTGAAFRDSDVSPGFHWYSVKVTRRSVVTPEQGISSPRSEISSAAEVKSRTQIESEKPEPNAQRRIPDFRRLPKPPGSSRSSSIPDAPFSYNLDFGKAPPGAPSVIEGSSEEGGPNDPRGPVLPVAVGMFLVSSALAVGKMPF